MRYALTLALTVFIITACGGGGGDPVPSEPIPLSTSTNSGTTNQIRYSVSGQLVSNINGTKQVSGTIVMSTCNQVSIGGTLSRCVQEYDDYGALGTYTSRIYGIRDTGSNSIIETGGMKTDGTTIAWDLRPATGPITYTVGDSWTQIGTITGNINGTVVARMLQYASQWSIDAIDDVKVPIGWYECYVASKSYHDEDLLTGIERVGTGTSYVRPEIGTIFATVNITATDGAEIITSTFTLEATSWN